MPPVFAPTVPSDIKEPSNGAFCIVHGLPLKFRNDATLHRIALTRKATRYLVTLRLYALRDSLHGLWLWITRHYRGCRRYP